MSTFIPTRIDAVTVYRRGALVTRVATIAEAATCGDLIRIGELPLSLEDRSVRVRICGGPGLVAADVSLGLDVAVVDPSLPPVESVELRAARRREQAVADRIEHLKEQLKRVGAEIAVPRPAGARGEAPPPSPHARRRAVAAFRQEVFAELEAELREASVEHRELREALAHLEARDREASNARQAERHEMRKTALVRIDRRAGAVGPREVRIEYMIPGARWAPAYTVTFDRAMSRATLALRAVVAQRSGEDWSRVKMTLSTADAQRWTELPELQSVRIGRRQPAPARRGWRPPPVGAEALYADYDRFVASQPVSSRAPAPTEEIEEAYDEPEAAEYGYAEDDDEEALDDLMEAAPPREHYATATAVVAKEEAKKRKSAGRREEGAGGPPPGAVFGGMPPPAPSAAPMPMSASMAMPMAPPAAFAPQAARARGGGLLSRLASAGGGGPSMDTGAYPRAGAFAPAEPEQEEDPSALLAYGDLRMPAAGASRRGHLVLIRRQERVRELIVAREAQVVTEVIAVLDQAQSTANTISGRLPPRHVLPDSVGGFDYAYVAEGEVEVIADGEYHAIPLLAREGPVAMVHVVVPREGCDVFRVATFKNPLDAPLLAGPVDVYVGGDYLLTSGLPLAAGRGEVRLGLGVEQAIKVSRNTHYAEESAGLIGGSLLLKHRIAIDVANRLERPVDVEVRERIPALVEGEDEISVEVGGVEPAWERYEPEEYDLKGGQRWRVQVAAGATQRLRASYTVKISAKKELVGGNRREV
ncbi:MAG: DUF4139 domain-containing protein [Myxococcales bacterium]|nr:DUF4139 domain-containing protein [Myxococcales bacterium]